MFDETQHKVELRDLKVADGIIMLQVIERVALSGKLQGNELKIVGDMRTNVVASIENATGVNFDQRAAELTRAQQAQQAQAAQQESSDDRDSGGDSGAEGSEPEDEAAK